MECCRVFHEDSLGSDLDMGVINHWAKGEGVVVVQFAPLFRMALKWAKIACCCIQHSGVRIKNECTYLAQPLNGN